MSDRTAPPGTVTRPRWEEVFFATVTLGGAAPAVTLGPFFTYAAAVNHAQGLERAETFEVAKRFRRLVVE